MFYTHKEFYDAVEASNQNYDALYAIKHTCTDSTGLNKKKVAETLRTIKKSLLDREGQIVVGAFADGQTAWMSLYKIMRPWSIVPALRDFSPPEGDFGIGVEVEYDFVTEEAAKEVMFNVRNWKHVALDREGGDHGVETTFPPILYSKLNKRDKPFRYLEYLTANSQLVREHSPGSMVGTHINISAHTAINGDRRQTVNNTIRYLSDEENVKYFGRRPYGYINHRSENANGNGYVEMKLFNSTTCPVTLRRYIDIGVSLVKLITGTNPINRDTVVEALEAGYNGRV